MTRTTEEREALARELGYASYAELVRISDEIVKRIREGKK